MNLEVWKASLEQLGRNGAEWETVLSADEIQRAERMAHEAARRRFLIGRGLLRHLLGEMLGVAPAAVRFAYSSAGKPGLDPAAHGEAAGAVPFSLSHSGDIIVFAVGGGRNFLASAGQRAAGGSGVDVGIDIEWTGRRRDCDGLVRRFATPFEQREYFALEPADRQIAFFRWWTRKEALIKACGISLARGLGTVDLPFGERSVYAVAPPALQGTPAHSWLIWTVPLEGGYWMSVARTAHPQVASNAFTSSSLQAVSTRHRSLPLTLVLRR